MIKLIIFDFDDTLINNDKVDYQSFVLSFKREKLPTPTFKEIMESRKKGFLAKEILVKHLKKIKKANLLTSLLLHRKEFLTSDDVLKYFYLKKDTKKLLASLKSKKIKCVLCSSRDDKDVVIKFLSKEKILNFFSNVFFKEDFGINIQNSNMENRIMIKKKLLAKIIDNELFSLDEILFIGNSKEDYLAARKNKIHFIYFQNSYLPTAPTRNNLIIIEKFLDINKALNRF